MMPHICKKFCATRGACMADLLMEDSEDEAKLVCTKEAMRWAPVQAARKSQGKHISSMNVLHSVLERIGAIGVLA